MHMQEREGEGEGRGERGGWVLVGGASVPHLFGSPLPVIGLEVVTIGGVTIHLEGESV